MTDPTAVTLSGAGEWFRAAAGTAVFLLPGLAAADRWMPGRLRLLWAPLWSFTLLVLGAVFLDFAFAVPVRTGTTLALALGLALLLARRRIVQGLRVAHSWWQGRAGRRAGRRPWAFLRPPWRPTRRHVLEASAAVVALALVAAAVYVPHAPAAGDEPGNPYLALASRVGGAVFGASGDPYPLHADEHIHLARMAALERSGRIQFADPYTGTPPDGDLLSVGGLRQERGFATAIVQLHLLTGAPLPTLFHYLPAIWGAFLALALGLTLRPAPGAWASAALVAIVHTSARFMGPSFLVPSAFGLPWIVGVVAVAARGGGPARLAGLLFLVTGAFLMHIVDGTLAMVAGLLCAVLMAAPLARRLALAGAVLLPLLWVWPSAGTDFVAAVSARDVLPFERHYLLVPGIAVFALAAGGTFAAWFRRDGPAGAALVPHRALSVLALGLLGSMAVSVAVGHRNEATYARLFHLLFVTLAALAGLGAAAAARTAARLLKRTAWRPAAAGAGTAAILLLALAHPLQAHLDEPYYRIFNDTSWQTARGLAAAGMGPDDTFLSHPWEAPVYNAFTGARPHTVLLPGAAPVRGQDYLDYLATGGSDAQWFADRGIGWAIGTPPPGAPHTELGPGIYRLDPLG